MAELVDIARRWQAAEPDNEDAHYYLCKQRLLCGEGESLLADLAISGSVTLHAGGRPVAGLVPPAPA